MIPFTVGVVVGVVNTGDKVGVAVAGLGVVVGQSSPNPRKHASAREIKQHAAKRRATALSEGKGILGTE